MAPILISVSFRLVSDHRLNIFGGFNVRFGSWPCENSIADRCSRTWFSITAMNSRPANFHTCSAHQAGSISKPLRRARVFTQPGSTTDISRRGTHVRFPPESRHRGIGAQWPLSANRRHQRPSRRSPACITPICASQHLGKKQTPPTLNREYRQPDAGSVNHEVGHRADRLRAALSYALRIKAVHGSA